jgi:Spy/CpxP family protein refolding chaperone
MISKSGKSKRKPVTALTPQQLQRQRERNRTYMRKFRALLSAEELERRREKDRLQKRRAREVMKHQKQDVTFQVTMFGHSA